MTEEELKRLCAKLRREYYDGEYAASEIERLVKRLVELETITKLWKEEYRHLVGLAPPKPYHEGSDAEANSK